MIRWVNITNTAMIRIRSRLSSELAIDHSCVIVME